MTEARKILVMGATSGIGAKVREVALSRGHFVRALARSADELAPSDRLEPFAADATDPDAMARAVRGVDAVIYALGISESLSMLWQEVTLFSDTTRVLIGAMADADQRRLVAVTGFGAGDSKNAMSWVERTGHRAILGKPYADKDRQEEMIRASDLDWTLVRPVILTSNGASNSYKVLTDPAEWRNGLISRTDVADYCVRAVEDGSHIRQGVVLTR